MLSFRTVWVTQPPGQPPVFDLFPDEGQAADPAQETLYITQDAAAFEELLPSGRAYAVDVLALHAFAFPDTPVESAAERLRQGGASGEGRSPFSGTTTFSASNAGSGTGTDESSACV